MPETIEQFHEKTKWKGITYSKPLPLQLILQENNQKSRRIKRYNIIIKPTDSSDPKDLITIEIRTKHIKKAMKKIENINLSIYDIINMNKSYVDPEFDL